jgi:hypothetical protein
MTHASTIPVVVAVAVVDIFLQLSLVIAQHVLFVVVV